MHSVQIRDLLEKLGVDPDIANVYLALCTHGPQSISNLARTTGIDRTRIYRLTDKLSESPLVETEVGYKRSIFKATPISNLHILVAQKEQELKNLKTNLNELEQSLNNIDKTLPNTTRVQFYNGAEGAKQMLWNETKAKTEVLALLFKNMQSNTLSKFFQHWVEKNNSLNIHHRGIFSDAFIASQQSWYKTHQNERLAYWNGRYISQSEFPIHHNMVVYNDVVAYYNWKAQEIFGIEIYSQDIANTQRAFFEMLWSKAMPRDDLTAAPKR